MKFEIEKLRKDACISTDKEFETKYPGVKRDAIQTMSDDELEKVVGGLGPVKWYAGGGTGGGPGNL